MTEAEWMGPLLMLTNRYDPPVADFITRMAMRLALGLPEIDAPIDAERDEQLFFRVFKTLILREVGR